MKPCQEESSCPLGFVCDTVAQSCDPCERHCHMADPISPRCQGFCDRSTSTVAIARDPEESDLMIYMICLAGLTCFCLAIILLVVCVVYRCTRNRTNRAAGDGMGSSAAEKGQLLRQDYHRTISGSTDASSATDTSGDVTCCGLVHDDKTTHQHICVMNQIHVDSVHTKGGIVQDLGKGQALKA